MRKLELLAIALALAVAVMLFYASPIWAAGSGRMNCDDWARTRVGEYLLENNVWGDKAADVCSFAGGDFFGWFWTKRFPTKHPIYPEVIYGEKPWLGKSTTGQLPRRIGEIRSLALKVDYATVAESYGWYNVLVDVWIAKSGDPTPDDVTDEIGIFLEVHGPLPEKEMREDLERGYETVEIGGATYAYVSGKSFKWRFHKFYLIGGKPEKLDVMEFVRYLNLSRSLYVASVEFGNEVWLGNGATIIKNIEVEVIDP